MATPYVDPLVAEKHRVQAALLDKVHGDLRQYSELVKAEAEKLRREHPGRFRTAKVSQHVHE